MYSISDSINSLYYELLIRLNHLYLAWQQPLRRLLPHFECQFTCSEMPIDIFIPAIEKDILALPLVIESARKNILHNINKIYVVSNSERISEICIATDCIFIDENTVLPITKNDINYKVNGLDRSGWIFQQLLKLYGDSVCESESFLVLDADTIFVRPTIFTYGQKTIFYFSDEFNVTYYRTFEKLLHKKIRNIRSFVSHMMLFNRDVLQEFRGIIEKIHEVPWYIAILESMEKNHMVAFSEYECYGNFFLQNRPGLSKLRYWHNRRLDASTLDHLNMLEKNYGQTCRTLSFHVYP